ncbi:DciA family protein [Nocardia sp. NPDC050175]|uniref:DciA family protein n=1 Tax=Nocardia sp. NPDC050175 TaxID=3364317 RepID=UPI0037BA2899
MSKRSKRKPANRQRPGRTVEKKNTETAHPVTQKGPKTTEPVSTPSPAKTQRATAQSGLRLIQQRWAQLLGPDTAATATPMSLVNGVLTIQCTTKARTVHLRIASARLTAMINGAAGEKLISSVRILGPDQADAKALTGAAPAAPAPALATGKAAVGGPKVVATEPTPEQHAAMAAFGTDKHLAIQAGAGTGKTTTLQLLAASTSRRGLYIAFNKAVADEARRRFPRNIDCRTTHSLAFGAVGQRYRDRLNAPRTPSRQVAVELGIRNEVRIGERHASVSAQYYATMRAVAKYCHSGDDTINARHVPRMRGIETDEHHHAFANLILPFARRAWNDLQNPAFGHVRFEHDHYLKMWALTLPELDYELLLLDEAQDTNPCLEQIFIAQRGRAQLIMVGDSAQAIYGWRGARDVMSGFDGMHLGLTQSFRFGAAVADIANLWLHVIDAPIRLTGSEQLSTEVGAVDEPDAIVCRTNAGAMCEVIAALDTGIKVALVGGGGTLRSLAEAARDLKAGRRATHHELSLFESWGEVQYYASGDPQGGDLLPFVKLIDEHGVEAILAAINKLRDEPDAQLTISTAHKAKGREWRKLRIASDFNEPAKTDDGQPGPINDDDARLAYVAVTRARLHLDLGSLAWIRNHPAGRPNDESDDSDYDGEAA